MKAVFATLFFASLFWLGPSKAANEPGLSAKGDRALSLLARTKVFRDSRVGFGGDLSEEVGAFRTLLSEPAADAACKWLVEHAALPGQLYGLCGLYFTDHDHFLALMGERFRDLPGEVQNQSMCVSRPVPLAWIVASISDGSYPERFRDPKRWRLTLAPSTTLALEP